MIFNNWIKKTLSDNKIKEFTEIQEKSINKLSKNHNFIGISYTGTGKTLAFLIPILNKINLEKGLQTIIILPTRELARQINNVLNSFKKNQEKLNSKLIIGGESINKQKNLLKTNPQIIITTPDRFLEILKTNYSNLNFSDLKNIILDEADMLLDLGFFNSIDKIISFLDKNGDIQKIAFSATFHELLSKKLSKYFKNTEIVNLTKKKEVKKNIEHFIIDNHDKFHSLSTLLNEINPYFCLIFANKKEEVDEIYKFLKSQKLDVTKIHGGLKNRERKSSYKSIKNNNHQFVVCSDLLSRGLDIDGASHIISWDLPNDIEWYFHRSGRTGRANYSGFSYILTNGKDNKILNKLIEKGISFKWLKIKNNQLINGKKKENANIQISDEQKNEIVKIFQKKKKKKPGYKKRQKEEIKKINQKYRKKAITEKMKQEKIRKNNISKIN